VKELLKNTFDTRSTFVFVASCIFLFFFGFYPEVSLVILGIFGLFKLDKFSKKLLLTVLIFAFIRVSYYVQIEKPFIFGLIEVLIATLLFLGGSFARRILNLKPQIVALIIICALPISFLGDINNLFQRKWSINQGLILKNISDSIRVVPQDLKDDYVYQSALDVRRVGPFEYRVQVRSDRRHRLAILIFSNSFEGNFAPPAYCIVSQVWRWCSIKTFISRPSQVAFVVGGFASWKSGDPPIEIRNPELVEGGVATIFERLLSVGRLSGLSFNPNAFGALLALFGLMGAIVFLSDIRLLFICLLPLTFIFLSGSRGALVAFVFGSLTLLLVRSRYYKVFPYFAVISLIAIVVLQVSGLGAITPTPSLQSQSALRSLDVVNGDTTRTRLEIWRLATKAWLENPRTVLFGAGDLTEVMKAKFDARASSFGLTKDSLTHAHNLWIQTAGESGLLGLCAMLWLWGWVILRAWRSRDAGALALLAAIFVINSVDYLFFYAPVHLAFWMAAAGLKQPEPVPTPLESSPIAAL
jgi:O-Antigen ligase